MQINRPKIGAHSNSGAENTIHRWKSKFGGMEVSEARRLRELEQIQPQGACRICLAGLLLAVAVAEGMVGDGVG